MSSYHVTVSHSGRRCWVAEPGGGISHRRVDVGDVFLLGGGWFRLKRPFSCLTGDEAAAAHWGLVHDCIEYGAHHDAG